MLIGLITLTSTLVFLQGTESTFLEPAKQCVPTATVRGPCHMCVCSHEGVFHCRPQKCKDERWRTRPKADCIPNYVFRQDKTFCRCSKDGFWLSDNCEAKFSYLYPRTNLPDGNLKTNIPCTANNLSLIDCNICQCPDNEVIDVNLCTSRVCGLGNKAESCSYGDILRLDKQLCSCSDIGYYIDRLCITILDEVAQPLNAQDILELEDIGKTWRHLSDLSSDVCDSTEVYTIDCNTCVCVDGHFVCTEKVCEREIKSALRQDRVYEIDALPLLKNNEGVTCEPGKKYRYDCNVCTCSMDGSPSCTTMVCLQDFVLDIKALREVLSSG